jgi:hypothetical protein
MNDKKEYETLFDKLREILILKDKQILKLEEENTKLRLSLSEHDKKKNNDQNSTSGGKDILTSTDKNSKDEINKGGYNTIDTTNTGTYRNINAIISGKLKENEKELDMDKEKYFSQNGNIKFKSNFNGNYISETQRKIHDNKQKEIFYTPSCGYLKSPNKNEHITHSHSKINESTSSRIEIKSYLQEVKEKIPAHNFKQFIKYIKILTDKNGVIFNRNEIFENVRLLFGTENKELYSKFEHILSIKN